MQPGKNLSKKEKSRIKILHAAKGLFERYGIDDVTFTQIAQKADVCRTTVFNHFADRRAAFGYLCSGDGGSEGLCRKYGI